MSLDRCDTLPDLPAAVLVCSREQIRPLPLEGSELAWAPDAGTLRRRQDWVAGRWIAKRLLAEWTGLSPHRVRIHGVPSGGVTGRAGDAAVHVSISHSAGHVAAAVSSLGVGIDVAEHADGERLLRVGTRAFTDSESALVQADTLAAVTAWTLKEAAIKCSGSGMFAVDGLRSTLLSAIDPPLYRDPGLTGRCFGLPDGIVAVALATGPVP